MSPTEIEEIKASLIEWINQLTDTNLLGMLDGVRQSRTEGDWWNDLSDEQKEHINEGLADIEAGRVISSEEFWKRLKQS